MAKQTSDTARQKAIVDVFVDHFRDLMQQDPDAWRGKFRKMSASPFTFYRGSAVLFYRDIHDDKDPFVNEKTGKVWIQGDLHAQNFGTYMNGAGRLVFDVNDFDEAYVAPFTWDVKRFAASLALIGYEKALSDAEIREIMETAAHSYAQQINSFATRPETRDFSINLSNAKGKLLDVLKDARLLTRVNLLDMETNIEDGDRRFKINKTSMRIDDATREKVMAAFSQYLTSIPKGKRQAAARYQVKDVIARRGMGIGSAGLPSFTFLLEGETEALENDILVYMKQSQEAAPARYVPHNVDSYFMHNGHRTTISQRALQAFADPLLGYTDYEGVGQFCAEVSPYTADLDWSDINKFSDILEVVTCLGQAIAKIHCVSDTDSDHTLVPFSVDAAIHEVLNSREADFASYIADFGSEYAKTVRRDHQLFMDAFRNKMFPSL